MNWQPGQWVECPPTQEKGKILPYKGQAICIALGHGITLYASPDALDILGWQPMQNPSENRDNDSSQSDQKS